MRIIGIGIAVSLIAALAVAAQAQQPAPTRVSGTVDSVNGSTFLLKLKDGANVPVKLADNAQVYGVEPAKIGDIKIGDFIAVGAMPQPDGSQKAIQVTIFPEAMRGVGEGFRPWDRPGTTMTNATVDNTVSGVDGQVVTVKYKDGEKKIIISSDAQIRVYIPSDRGELKAGSVVAMPRADRQPDGTLQTARVYIGRNGLIP